MKIIKGNLISLALAGEFEVIIHGCNCFCTMGAGIAGGNWQIITKIIATELDGENHTLVILDG